MAHESRTDNDLRMIVLGITTKDLIQTDFNRIYDESLTETERNICAGNIASKIREFREYSRGNEQMAYLVSCILGKDLDELETEVVAVSKKLSKDEARCMVQTFY